MGRADWRSASNYAATFELDRGGFSWELLRRNPNYRRDYDQGVSHTLACGEAGPFPAAWGLRFRSGPRHRRSADLLDRGRIARGASVQHGACRTGGTLFL